MGRLGITIEDVENAVIQLQGQGKSPTVDNVRELLGTGSKSTIIQHLKLLRSKLQESQGKLPPELLSLVTGLWERLNNLTDQRVIENQSKSDSIITELCDTIHKLQNEYTELSTKLNDTKKQLDEEINEKETKTQKLDHEEREHAQAKQKLLISSQIIEDQKTENARLHQLASNIQTNLEHYQRAMQQARAEQLLQIESQQTKFQQELSHIKLDLDNSRSKLQTLEQQLFQREVELQQEKTQKEILQNESKQQGVKLQDYYNELIIYKDRCEQQKKQYDHYQIELEHKNRTIIEFQNQIVLLNYKLEQQAVQLETVTKDNTALRQKNLELIQKQNVIKKKEGRDEKTLT